MSGACRMQELKYIRDGATLVISLDGLNWLFKRRCSDKGIKKRDEELQLLISSGQMMQADEELQAIACILHQRGSAAPQLWRNSDCRSSLVTRPPLYSSSPRRHCLPEEHHSALTSLASFAPWTRLILNMQDIFSLIQKDLNIVTQRDTVDQHNRFIIFCDEDIPLLRFGDICDTKHCRTSIGEDTGWHISHNMMLSDLKNSTAQSPTTHSCNGNRHELVRDNFNSPKSLLKSCQIYDAPGVLSGRDTSMKRRKSVSFDDDVMVYLFDQESPTVELHSEACTSPPDVTLEDSGLEWEDDFSALEKNFHLHQRALSLPTQSGTALSRRFVLSQTCLFLTHVTESDLELSDKGQRASA